MKISLGFKSLPPHNIAAARSSLVINLLCVPGLGSWIAGRKIGVIQMMMSIGGCGLTIFWFVTFLYDWARQQQFPSEGGTHLLLGLAGVVLFVFAWLWALGTSLSIMYKARRN